MLTLATTNHASDCRCVGSESFSMWGGFASFRGLDWYKEYMLFRYYVKKIGNEYYLNLYYVDTALIKSGLKQDNDNVPMVLSLYYVHPMTGKVYRVYKTVTGSDLSAINAHLVKESEKLQKMWAEVE